MTKQTLTTTVGFLFGLGIITFFIPGFKVWSYGLLTLGFGGLMYAGYVFGGKNQRFKFMVGVLILFLLALSKFFDSLVR